MLTKEASSRRAADYIIYNCESRNDTC